MAQKFMIVALGLFAAASPSLAAGTGPTAMPALSDSPDALYCLRIEAVTGTRLETVRCWTRAEWAEQGVDVDADWAEEGVSIIQPRSAVLS